MPGASCFFDSETQGIIIADQAGRIAAWNDTAVRLLNVANAETLQGMALREITAKDDTSGFSRAISEAEAGKVVMEQIRGQSRFGPELNCNIILMPYAMDQGNQQGLTLILFNDPIVRPIAHGLLQSEKMAAMETVVAGIAHELNNPLTAILGYTELLLTGDLTENQRKRLSSIVDEAQRCRKIVENLRSFSSERQSEKTPCNMNELIRNVVLLMEYQLERDKIELSIHLQDDLPELFIQRHEMEGVILSLLRNAQQALIAQEQPNGRISIESWMKDNVVYFSIADNGPGIPEEMQSKIFDPFFTTRGLGEGLGLGLSIAHGVIQHHFGRIQFASQPDTGTQFTIELPVKQGY